MRNKTKPKTGKKIIPRTQKRSRPIHRHILVSVLFVVENNASHITSSLKEIYEVCKTHFKFFEILIIDNGSTDQTVLKIRNLQRHMPHIRLMVLSKKYDIEIALFAGLENSIGDYLALVDIVADPASLIIRLIEKAVSGYDMVIAENKEKQTRDNFAERVLSHLYYRMTTSVFNLQLSAFSSYTRALSRRALNSIVRIQSKNRFLKYTNQLIGFGSTTISYSQKKSPHAKKRSLWSRIGTGISIIISNSALPLRITTTVGFIASLLSLLFLIYVFAVILVKKKIAEGWITTSMMNATMFFLLFSILTVISEYIARILEETKDQPLYFIAEEFTSSSLSTDKKNLNVI